MIAMGMALLVPAFAIGAQANNNGALDLLLPIGARATAMGTAVAAEQNGEALWWNPAGIARLTKPELALDHFQRFPIESGDAISLVLPAGPVGVFGIAARLFNYGTQSNTTGSGEEIGTTGQHSVVVGGTFAATFGQRFSGGLTFRIYQFSATCSGICDATVSGAFTTSTLDAGIQFRPSPTSPLAFGAQVSNIGPNLQVHDQPQSDPLAKLIRVGVSYTPTSPSWDPALRVRLTSEVASTTSFGTRELHLGGEVGYVTPQATLLARAGYVAQGSTGSESSTGPSVGFGIASGRVQLDFARIFESFSTGLGVPPTYISIRVGL
jgi:Uncharacterised protein family (UPF0164)